MRMWRAGGIVVSGIYLLFSCTVFAQDTNQGRSNSNVTAAKPADLSRLLKPILVGHELPGLAAAVLRNHKLIAIGAAGVRRRGSAEPLTIKDKFLLGSCTKSMTATVCATLVQEGKLRWSLTVGEVFPALTAQMHPEFAAVTLEQLLTHHGECPAELAADSLWKRLADFTGSPIEARRLLLEGVMRKAPVATPGTRYIYSNAGYAIAGHMAETVAHQSWEDLVRERLFKPLRMEDSGFLAPGTIEILDQPRGHRDSGEPVEPGPLANNPIATAPAGAVHCTMADWARYIAIHVNSAKDSQIISNEMLSKLQTPYVSEGDKLAYAMGWVVTERRWAGGVALNHSGSNKKWMTLAWLAPKRHLAILVACNQGGDEALKACDETAELLVNRYAPASTRR